MSALNLIYQLIERVRSDGPWDIAQAPDGHSFAWHGVFVLFHAAEYLRDGKIRPEAQRDFGYQPIFTR